MKKQIFSSVIESVESSSFTEIEKPIENPASSTINEENPVHTHRYTAPTCKKPSICVYCGQIKGDPISHKYADATCQKPATCIYCGKTAECDRNNPDDPKHDWDITYITTEPKWCKEMHIITDYGYDINLASQLLGVDYGEAGRIFLDNMEAIGVNGHSGDATTTIQVWGTETFETRKCKAIPHNYFRSIAPRIFRQID